MVEQGVPAPSNEQDVEAQSDGDRRKAEPAGNRLGGYLPLTTPVDRTVAIWI
jgi:hypothetical protein